MTLRSPTRELLRRSRLNKLLEKPKRTEIARTLRLERTLGASKKKIRNTYNFHSSSALGSAVIPEKDRKKVFRKYKIAGSRPATRATNPTFEKHKPAADKYGKLFQGKYRSLKKGKK